MNLIKLKTSFELFEDLFSPKEVLSFNNQKILLVKVFGDKVPWHTHDNGDEVFIVYQGEIHIHLDDRTVKLNKGEIFKVEKGVRHKITSKSSAKLILLQEKDTKHTGDIVTDITKNEYSKLS